MWAGFLLTFILGVDVGLILALAATFVGKHLGYRE